MNRRDLLQAAAAAIVPCTVSEQTIAPDEEPVFFKVTLDRIFSRQAMDALRESLRAAFSETKWRDVPVIVCPAGVDVAMHRENGRTIITTATAAPDCELTCSVARKE